MNNEYAKLDECVALLTDIVARWPKANSDHPEGDRSTLAFYLAQCFEDVDLLNKIETIASIERVDRTSEGAEIEFYDVDGCRHKAVFVLTGTNEWRLRSLKFQCPVCFGEGVNNGSPCDMCGGSGWGAS